jgi:hypothetical protein
MREGPSPFDVPTRPRGRRRKVIGWTIGVVIVVAGLAAIGSQHKTDLALRPAAGPAVNMPPAASVARPLNAAPGQAFPGEQPGDVVAGPGAQATTSGVTLTTSTWARENSYGQALICGQATMRNTTAATFDYTLTRWQLESPSGNVADRYMTLGASDLISGSLVPGGTVAGRVCFADPAQRGTYVVLWSKLTGGPRAAWLLTG